jgi:pimeloyl-ACP methyl ester carboxylesterase
VRRLPIRVASTDGVTLAVHDLGGEGPDVLLCHPTGFHGRVWDPVAALLAPVAHCWALDFRGHGASGVPTSGSFAWRGMVDDVLATVDDLALTGVRGVGHSMGGAALLMAEQARPGTMQALWCFEPIVFPPPEGRPATTPTGNPLATAARRRRRWFPDREVALAHYAAKPPLGAFDPDALAAYVEHGFRDLPDGGVELRCTPEVEAAVFEGASGTDAFARLGEVRCPTTVAAGGDGGLPAQVAALVARSLPHGRLHPFPALTHFGPMEDPAAVAGAVRDELLPLPG